MSRTVTLAGLIRAIALGDVEASADTLAAAIVPAVVTLATHGTRAPLAAAAAAAAECVIGRGKMARAIATAAAGAGLITREGADWVPAITDKRGTLPGIQPGKHSAEDAASLAETLADAFALNVMGEASAKQPKSKADPVKVAARALAALSTLTDAQFLRALGTNEGADMLARIARVQAVKATADAVKAARKAAAPAAAPAAAEVA